MYMYICIYIEEKIWAVSKKSIFPTSYGHIRFQGNFT